MNGRQLDTHTTSAEETLALLPHAEFVLEMLALIGIKRLGQVPLTFIAYIGPEIIRLNAEAIREVLQDALADDADKSMTLATFYQPALRYCERHGLSLERSRLSLEWWQPEQNALIQ